MPDSVESRKTVVPEAGLEPARPSSNELEKIENCPIAFWECVGDRACPILSHNDADIMKLIHSWQSLGPATRKSILVLAQDEIDAS